MKILFFVGYFTLSKDIELHYYICFILLKVTSLEQIKSMPNKQ